MIVAVYRNCTNAVKIKLRRVLDDEIFESEHGHMYDITEPIKRHGVVFRFDKFRLDKQTAAKISLRCDCSAQDRETETEPSNAVHEKMTGSYRQRSVPGSRS